MSDRIRSLDDFLTLFPESPRKKICNGWNVICCAHSDRKPSLSVTLKESIILLKCQAETSLIPHGKVLSPVDYILTLPDLSNLPNPLCPVSGVHSSRSAMSENDDNGQFDSDLR